MQPKYPIYIPSKGRADTRLTMKSLDRMDVPYTVVVEAQEFDQYAAVIDPLKLLVLDPAYQHDYDACFDIESGQSKGSGPARNFIWDHAIASGHKWHWIIDDNIINFYRLNQNAKNRVYDGAFFRTMEDFVERYENVAMAGPHYHGFATQRSQHPPFLINTRIYSCNLIRNDLPFRWRGRYNEDTILSLDMLKAGWCTILFYAFLQHKTWTLTMKGGNTDEIYRDGTLEKSRMLVREHPDVSRLVWKFGRWHHHVDYRRFKRNKLKRKEGLVIPDRPNEYGMVLTNVSTGRTAERAARAQAAD